VRIYILAGGDSTRMKNGDKPHITLLEDSSMLEFIIANFGAAFGAENVRIVAKNSDNFAEYEAEVIEDVKNAGPLGGIMTGLMDSDCDKNFFLACDMPFFPPRAAEFLLQRCSGDVLIPVDEDDYFEPLAAVYRRSCLPAVERAVKRKRKQIIAFFSEIDLEKIDKRQLQDKFNFNHMFFNVNTREQLQRAKREVLPNYLQSFQE